MSHFSNSFILTLLTILLLFILGAWKGVDVSIPLVSVTSPHVDFMPFHCLGAFKPAPIWQIEVIKYVPTVNKEREMPCPYLNICNNADKLRRPNI